MSEKPNISKTRFFIGTTIFILGFCSPLLIPLFASSDLSTLVKTTLSGALVLGVPEVFMVIAIAILGKEGYLFLKMKIWNFFKPYAPANEVSFGRYRIGLFLFCLPLVIGWAFPYLSNHFPELKEMSVWCYIGGDIIFCSSFFVLGGEFWDKFSGLFSHTSKIISK
jgi:hypothetical protein